MYYIQKENGEISKGYSSYYEALTEKNKRFMKGEKRLKIKETITKNEQEARKEVRTWARINKLKEKANKNT